MNVKDYVLKVVYECDGQIRWLIDDNDDILSFEDMGDSNHIKLKVRAKKPVKIVLAELIYDHYFESEEWFYGGGYQSWSTSKEYKRGDRQYGLRFPCSVVPLAKTFAAASGDVYFTEYGKDLYHGLQHYASQESAFYDAVTLCYREYFANRTVLLDVGFTIESDGVGIGTRQWLGVSVMLDNLGK